MGYTVLRLTKVHPEDEDAEALSYAANLAEDEQRVARLKGD